MCDDSNGHMADGDRSLDVAAWHLQMLLTSLASFDGKIMFLTALNVAGTSALIGVVIAAEPSTWLLTAGFLLLSACATLGLGVLWSANLQQFPSPEEIGHTINDTGDDPPELARRHFATIRDASERADDQLRLRIRTMRTLLLATPVALIIVVVTAITSAT